MPVLQLGDVWVDAGFGVHVERARINLAAELAGTMVALSRSGAYVLMRESNTELGLYRVSDGVRVQRLRVPEPAGIPKRNGSFTANDTHVAFGVNPGRVLVYEVVLDQPNQFSLPVQDLATPSPDTNMVRYNPSGTRLASAGHDHGGTPGQVRIWNTADWSTTWQPQKAHGNRQGEAYGQWIAWSPNGQYLALGSANNNAGSLGVYDYQDESNVWWNNHFGSSNFVSFMVHPNGNSVVVGRKDYKVFELALADGASLPGAPDANRDWGIGWPMAVYHPPGAGFSIVGGVRVNGHNIRAFHPQSHDVVWSDRLGGARGVQSAAFTPDQAQMVVGTDDNTILIYNSDRLTSGNYIPRYDHREEAPLNRVAHWLLDGHTADDTDVAHLSPSGGSFHLVRPITWAPRCGNGVVDPGRLLMFNPGQAVSST